ncbi:septum site-determining protein Ssd [Millisia brevis]|uniref:septum site-determining protein Ssd n=1 Tax=Millisia brevis TaxID=264148 RepID=UPI0014726134|nr:septum site-determining protein Ssd [Millisia brevis]
MGNGSKTATTDPGVASAVLVAVADAGLRADIRRAAAAAGASIIEVTSTTGDGRADGPADPGQAAPVPSIGPVDWRAAHAVVLDTAAAEAILRAGPVPRDRVILVAAGRAELSHWRLAGELGSAGVLVLPRDDAQLARLLAAGTERAAGGGLVAVVGARGGAGASCFAVALARACITPTSGAADDRRRVLLIDADRLGGGLDLLIGWEDRPGIRWPDLVAEEGRIAADALFAAVPAGDGLAVLSGARTTDGAHPGPAAMRAVLDAVRASGDPAVVDCPRVDDAAADLAIGAADLVVVICPATTPAIAAAGPVIGRLRALTSEIGVVVRGPSALGRRPSEVADLLELPLLAAMRPEPGLDARIDRQGWTPRRRSPLLICAETVADRLGDRIAR